MIAIYQYILQLFKMKEVYYITIRLNHEFLWLVDISIKNDRILQQIIYKIIDIIRTEYNIRMVIIRMTPNSIATIKLNSD